MRHAPTVTATDEVLTKPFRSKCRVTNVHVDGGLTKRVKARTVLALLTAAAVLAVGMTKTADAKPADPPPATCAQPGGCTELANGQL